MGMEVDAKQAKINKHRNSRSTVTNGSIRDWNWSNGRESDTGDGRAVIDGVICITCARG